MSCSTLLDVEELWVKGSSANECLFRASEGLPLHLSDWCIFKQNLKSKWKCMLVFSRCFFTVERFWRWVECPRALTTSASSHLNTLDLNPFSAHIAFLSFKEVEQGHREGNCRILVRTVEMHVFSVQNGAVGVGHSAFKILPPSLPAGWWVWESLPLFQFWLSLVWEEWWVIVAAAPLPPITAPLCHQGAFLFWKLASVRDNDGL